MDVKVMIKLLKEKITTVVKHHTLPVRREKLRLMGSFCFGRKVGGRRDK
jgi:hypothetical protein